MRYDEKSGVYRDCKWCGGRGCLSCPAEAKKEYERQFPDGPKPIFEAPNTPEGVKSLVDFLKAHSIIGGPR